MPAGYLLDIVFVLAYLLLGGVKQIGYLLLVCLTLAHLFQP